jgi:hypothetical protein
MWDNLFNIMTINILIFKMVKVLAVLPFVGSEHQSDGFNCTL